MSEVLPNSKITNEQEAAAVQAILDRRWKELDASLGLLGRIAQLPDGILGLAIASDRTVANFVVVTLALAFAQCMMNRYRAGRPQLDANDDIATPPTEEVS